MAPTVTILASSIAWSMLVLGFTQLYCSSRWYSSAGACHTEHKAAGCPDVPPQTQTPSDVVSELGYCAHPILGGRKDKGLGIARNMCVPTLG
jgi:hypothetical protein